MPAAKKLGNDVLLETAGVVLPEPSVEPPAPLRTPDLTLAQIVAALFASVEPVLSLLSVELSKVQANAIDDLWKIAAGLLASDAVIRVGRSVGNRR